MSERPRERRSKILSLHGIYARIKFRVKPLDPWQGFSERIIRQMRYADLSDAAKNAFGASPIANAIHLGRGHNFNRLTKLDLVLGLPSYATDVSSPPE
jgi:hypothetical protein